MKSGKVHKVTIKLGLKAQVHKAENETKGLWGKEAYPKSQVPGRARQAQRTVRCDWRASPTLAEHETGKLSCCQTISRLVLDIGITEGF